MRSGLGRLLKPKATGGPDEPPFFGVLRETIAATPGIQRIALLPADNVRPLAVLLKDLLPEAEVHVFRPALTPSGLHVRMAAVGRFDLIVDTTTGRGRYGRAQELLMRANAGGVVVVRALPPKVRRKAKRKRASQDRRELAQLLGGVGHATIAEMYPAPGKLMNDAERLAHVVASAAVVRGHVVARSRQAVLAKIREEEVGSLLELKGEFGSVISERPASRFESRATVRESWSEYPSRIRPGYPVPAMQLRCYRDALCVPGQLVSVGNVILPDSFRHNQSARNGNRYLIEVGARFGLLPLDGQHVVDLAGEYFYLDSEFRGHFGHAMTEVISRLWAWREAKERSPGLKALMCMNKNRHLAEYEVELFAAAGIPRDDIVFSYDPVRVETLYAATPMFSQPSYVHPDIAETWRRIGDNLAGSAEVTGDLPSRIFVSRRNEKRACSNAREVESLFVAHGFEVVFPEDLDLASQIARFRAADVLAGFAGSGLFNMCMVTSRKRVIIVSPESYTAQNEYQMAAVLGHEIDVAWCRSDGERTQTGWSWRSLQAGYTFDMDGPEGDFVRDVLTTLDEADA